MSSVSAVNTLLSSSAPTTSPVNISSILAASAGTSAPGIDVTAAVAAAIYADRAQERIWQGDQTTLTSQTTALTSIQTATAAITTDMEALNTLTGPLSARTVTSSSSDVTATAAEGTTLGNHTVVVNSLAAQGSWYSSLESGPTAALATGSFTLTTATGASATFQTGTASGTAGDTLTDLAATINSYVSPTGVRLGVTATVVSDSTGSRLAIVSNSAGAKADFSVSEPFTSWTAPEMSSGESLGANSLTLTSSAGTATIATTSGESYATLAAAINSAQAEAPPTSYNSALGPLTATTPLTVGSVTTIDDASTGKTFTYTAIAGSTVASLNSAIAAAVTTGTLSPNVAGTITGGNEVISEGTSDPGITVSTTDPALGAMTAAPGATGSPSTSYSTELAPLTATTPLTVGSVTTIDDASTGKTFKYTAVAGSTVASLNSAIAAAVATHTLSASVAGTITGGNEVISEGTSNSGITVSTNDPVLGAMDAAPGLIVPLGLIATNPSDPNSLTSTNLTIASPNGTTPFSINEPSSTGTTFQFTQAVAGADASITVDGVPADYASNTITGAIPGVTLTLLGTTSGGPADLSIGSDAAQVSTAINQFVSDYNTALGLVNAQFNFSSTTGTQGALASDPTIVALQSTLEQALNYLSPPATGTTTVSTLNDLGISAGTDGLLTVNSTTLDNALTNNPTDVQNFFEGPSLNGFANSLSNTLNSYTDPAKGAFTVDLSGISSSSAGLTSQINDFETNYIANQQAVLTAMYSSAEIALQQLPQKMQELNSELGFTSNGSSSG
jgi:flagellar hook-associated protein 2